PGLRDEVLVGRVALAGARSDPDAALADAVIERAEVVRRAARLHDGEGRSQLIRKLRVAQHDEIVGDRRKALVRDVLPREHGRRFERQHAGDPKRLEACGEGIEELAKLAVRQRARAEMAHAVEHEAPRALRAYAVRQQRQELSRADAFAREIDDLDQALLDGGAKRQPERLADVDELFRTLL